MFLCSKKCGDACHSLGFAGLAHRHNNTESAKFLSGHVQRSRKTFLYCLPERLREEEEVVMCEAGVGLFSPLTTAGERQRRYDQERQKRHMVFIIEHLPKN